MLVVAVPDQTLLWETTERLVDESYGPSQGRFFPEPFPHLVVALTGLQDERVLVHEFTHAIFCSYRLPRWFDEGLALIAEENVFGSPEILRSIGEWDETEVAGLTVSQLFDEAWFDHDDLNFRGLAYWYAFQVVRGLYASKPSVFGPDLKQHSVEFTLDVWLEVNFGVSLEPQPPDDK